MTEQEAKQKWCPMVRIDTGVSSSYNAFKAAKEQVNEGRCIGSDCMMWREYRPSEMPDADPLYVYCGLGGKP